VKSAKNPNEECIFQHFHHLDNLFRLSTNVKCNYYHLRVASRCFTGESENFPKRSRKNSCVNGCGVFLKRVRGRADVSGMWM
jgi:hypothetical protein